MLGASCGTQIVLKTNQKKKPKLTCITFPQWSATNFRKTHSLIKEGALSAITDIMNYIWYGTKASELAKIYPIARVVQHDDPYRQMQFANLPGGPLTIKASNTLYTIPPSLNSHSSAELYPNYFSVGPHAGGSLTASSIAGEYPNIGLGAAECVTTCNQSAGPSCIDVQQPYTACISTDLSLTCGQKS